MSRAHLFRSLQDAAGNLQRGATVNLYQPGTTTLITATIYADGSTNNPLSQPIACPDGFLSVYFDLPARFRVGVTPYGGGTEVLFEGIDAIQPLQPASETVLAPIAGLTSLDVQSALAELQQTKYGPGNSDPASTSITADRVFYTAYGSVTASEVQHAIQQLTDAKYGPDVPPPASGVTFTPADTIGSTDVQAALVEVEGDIQAHVAQAAGAHAASAVSFAPTGDLASTTVQAAIVELDSKRIGTVQDEGTPLTQRGIINFIGAQVTATDDAANNRTNVTVTPTPPPVQTRYALSTVGAGLPSFVGRIAGDLHENTTDGNEYVLTGVAGAMYSDTFTRADSATLGPLEAGGVSWAQGAAYLSGGTFGMVIASNQMRPSTDANDLCGAYFQMNGTPLGFDMTFDLIDLGSSNHSNGFSVAVGITDPTTAPATGTWRFAGSLGTTAGNNAFYLYAPDGTTAASVSTPDPAGVWNTGASSSIRFLISPDGKTCTIYRDGAVLLTGTSASAPTGTYVGFAGRNSNAANRMAYDNIQALRTGTLAWTNTDSGAHVVNNVFSTKTANYTLTTNDAVVFFSGTNLTATLPSPTSLAGHQLVIKNLDTTVLTVSPSSGTIDGNATHSLAQYDSVTLVSDGTNWGVI